PLSLLVMAATALLAVAYVLARTLIAAPYPATRHVPQSEPRMRFRRRYEGAPVEDVPPQVTPPARRVV
ncbi:MAG: hypothetical protein ACRECX_13885, partial [Methyloceanibacter sp.]|uniref:hypothetical protein n=1 Tax=Methyloceanibacter sp. TaxID=1965321 RepID=UPI003D6C7F7D